MILYCLLIIFFPASRATRVDFAWSRIGSGFLYPSCTCRIVNTACLLHWRYQGKITSEGALHLFSDLETSTHSLRVVICLLSKLGCPVALGQVLTLMDRRRIFMVYVTLSPAWTLSPQFALVWDTHRVHPRRVQKWMTRGVRGHSPASLSSFGQLPTQIRMAGVTELSRNCHLRHLSGASLA